MSAAAPPGIQLPPLASSTELNKTFGVLLIGFIFAVTLYGLTFFREFSLPARPRPLFETSETDWSPPIVQRHTSISRHTLMMISSRSAP